VWSYVTNLGSISRGLRPILDATPAKLLTRQLRSKRYWGITIVYQMRYVFSISTRSAATTLGE
jgi:hypothetical protein